MSDLLPQVLVDAEALSKEHFVAKYPHPWLLCEVNKAPAQPPAQPPARLVIASPATAVLSSMVKKPEMAKPNYTSVRSKRNLFTLYPIVKTDRNPWADRILVGRAKNNDVVLNNQAVSKVHAYFTKSGPRLLLCAYQTLNPTLLKGMPIEPGASGEDVNNGDDIVFAVVHCRYFESAAFYVFLSNQWG